MFSLQVPTKFILWTAGKQGQVSEQPWLWLYIDYQLDAPIIIYS